MIWLYSLLILLALYLFTVFFLSRFFVPFLGFRKRPSPKELPPEMEQTIKELEWKTLDQKSYLQAAYDFVRGRWHSERFKTLTELPLAFRTDLAVIWGAPGYAHCTTINFVLYTLLIHSKYFEEQDIRLRCTIFNLQAKFPDRKVVG